MPWKLILFLIFLVFTTIFVGFNLDNTCTINVIFKTFTDAPISIVVLISVIFGAFISALFMVGMKFSQTKKKDVKKEVKKEVKKTKPVEPTTVNFNYDDAVNVADTQIVKEKESVIEKPVEGSDA